MRRAIQRGQLRPPSDFLCVDCGDPATEYDHRDYAKPLEVEPVCRPCNSARGSAKNNDRPYHKGVETDGYGFKSLWENSRKERGIERPLSDFLDEHWITWEPDLDLRKMRQEIDRIKRENRPKRRQFATTLPTKSFLRGLYDWFGVEP